MLSLYPVSSFEQRLFFLALAKLGDYLSLYGAPGMRRAAMWFPLVSIGSRGFCVHPGEVPTPHMDLFGFFRFHPPDAVTIRQATAITLSERELGAS